MTLFDPGEFGGVLLGGTSPTSFVHGAGQVNSDITVEWDFDNDGDFDESEENVTGYLMAGEAQTGRDFPSQLSSRAGPGQLQLTLLNEDDRFSYFNSASPLNAGNFSLRVGRKIRVRTSSSTPDDPVLLVRDRFTRPDGALGTTETGQAWSFSGGAGTGTSWFQIAANRVVAQDSTITVQAAFVDSGDADQYTQVTIADDLFRYFTSKYGIIARRVDNNNFVELVLALNAGDYRIELAQTVAGVRTVLSSYNIWPWPGLTLGLLCVGTAATGYVSGTPVLSGTTSNSTDETVGIIYRWDNDPPRTPRPSFDSFYVWSGVAAPINGVIWTGDVTEVKPSTSVTSVKTVVVTAEGRLAHAALPDVVRPRVVKESITTGFGPHTGLLVGDVLAKSNLLHPPGPIDEGTLTIGPLAISDGKALDLARQFETVENGFLHETNEGAIGFQGRGHRAGAVSVATFSDSPGAEFGYTDLTPLDQRRDIINRVTVGLSPDQVDGITLTVRQNSTAAGVANHVDVLLPTTAAGDLLLVIIASTVSTTSVGWRTPIWWVNHRSFGTADDDSIRTRIYSHNCDGTESGTTVRFYNNSGTLGGAWIAHVYRLQDWFEAVEGIAVAPPVNGSNPPPLVHGFGRVPSVFIAWNAALTSVNGGSFNGDDWIYPSGYGDGSETDVNGTVNGFDVALQTAWKFSVDESDDPTTFAGFSDYVINEAGLIAIRGFNGPHVVVPTLKNPSAQFQESPGRFVTVDDITSQDELRTIRSNPDLSNLFASEVDAQGYADMILNTYGDDRPIFSLTFVATTSAAYRAQAYRRRVGDLIRLVADGATGMGVNADFFIESINHRWTEAGKIWETTWELSPA